jgi:hypothetical protein
MKRDFADFWNLLWELALGVCAAFALLNLFAPQQDLPWKPLDLNRPIGTATAAKVADFELAVAAAPEETTAVTEACMQVLREAGVQVEGPRTGTTAASASSGGRSASPAGPSPPCPAIRSCSARWRCGTSSGSARCCSRRRCRPSAAGWRG